MWSAPAQKLLARIYTICLFLFDHYYVATEAVTYFLLKKKIKRFFIVYMIINMFKVSFESSFNAQLLAEHTLDQLLRT